MRLHPRRIARLSVLLLPLLSGACETVTRLLPGRVEIQRVTPPAALLDCRPAPQVPPDPVSDRDAALYVLALDDAGGDCRDKLKAVKDWAAK